jgi:hypothetical protein
MSRLKVVLTVAAVAVGSGVGAVAAAPNASAATAAPLCIHDTIHSTGMCAVPFDSVITTPVDMEQVGIAATWLYNGPSHGPGQIQQDGTGMCLQLDAAAGYTVIEAACNRASYQSWQAIAVSGGWAFRSQWNTSQCLTYNRERAWLDTVACDGQWYQTFDAN